MEGKKEDGGSSSQFYTACILDQTHGASTSNPSMSTPPSSVYYSARIQSMMENRWKFSNELEFEKEYSKVHYSELDSETSHGGTAKPQYSNFKYFKELNLREFAKVARLHKSFYFSILDIQQTIGRRQGLNSGSCFFKEMGNLIVGEKIGEGSQAEIYQVGEGRVAKVFHEGNALQDLEKQWPPGMLEAFLFTFRVGAFCNLHGATLLKDARFLGRFAIVMNRQWGDLRKLIDLQMQEGKNLAPPFTVEQVWKFVFDIALGMYSLHEYKIPVLHRDLKAANVLLSRSQLPSLDEPFLAIVADFECSVGVIDTRFFRAPEILQQLKNRVPRSSLKFTKMCDVYSFAMTCYESLQDACHLRAIQLQIMILF